MKMSVTGFEVGEDYALKLDAEDSLVPFNDRFYQILGVIHIDSC